MDRPRASCGYIVNSPRDLSIVTCTVIETAKFDFVCVPIVHPRYKFPEKPSANGDEKAIVRNYPHTRSDLSLRSTDWMSALVGIMTRDLNVESGDAKVRAAAIDRLMWELSYATHLGLSAVMIEVNKPDNPNLARVIRSFLAKQHGPMILLKIPLNRDSWHWWNTIRSFADYDKRLGIALTLSKDVDENSMEVRRWLGEPIKILVINTRFFLTNKKGYQVLPRSLQPVVKLFIDQKVQFVIEGNNGNVSLSHYQQYLNHLVGQHVSQDPVRNYAQGFEDFLQNPLQPLMDNLESTTYEVFEKDPVKYTEYENAIAKALMDRVSDEEAQTKTLVLMVLGAGRGPIVRAALRASETTGRKVKVFAVEKNPFAVVTLFTLKEEVWKDKVEVIPGDMRNWKPTEDQLADIIISELLGSFADNELSPECLYSAQHLMKPDGISIPSSYTSWIGPLQSSKLYQEVRGSSDPEKNPEAHFETPYVVHFQNRFEIAKPKPLFTFEHPIRDAPIELDRYDVKKFSVDHDCVLNGFAGYFECVLYKDVVISTNPETHSKGMFSWFPIFFPLRIPVQCTKGSEVEVHFWRINNSKNVWYEWCISKPTPVSIHNPNGRSYTIGL